MISILTRMISNSLTSIIVKIIHHALSQIDQLDSVLPNFQHFWIKIERDLSELIYRKQASRNNQEDWIKKLILWSNNIR